MAVLGLQRAGLGFALGFGLCLVATMLLRPTCPPPALGSPVVWDTAASPPHDVVAAVADATPTAAARGGGRRRAERPAPPTTTLVDHAKQRYEAAKRGVKVTPARTVTGPAGAPFAPRRGKNRCNPSIKLSVIMVTRNDDYGFDRMVLALKTLTEFPWKRGTAEVVIVEWNFIADHAPLQEQIAAAGLANTIPIRVVRVPPGIHNRYRYSDLFPILQYIGKNAGARRAKGHHILVTNMDNLFSQGIMHWLNSVSSAELGRRTVYLNSRPTLDDPILARGEIRLHEFVFEVPKTPCAPEVMEYRDTHNNGDFQLMSCELYHEAFGYAQTVQMIYGDSDLSCRLHYYNQNVTFHLFKNQRSCHVYHQPHPTKRAHQVLDHVFKPLFNCREYRDPATKVHPPPQVVNDGWGLPDDVLEEAILRPKPSSALASLDHTWERTLADHYQPILDRLHLEYLEKLRLKELAEQDGTDGDDGEGQEPEADDDD